MKKKLLSLALALALVVSLGVSALAADTKVPVIPCSIQWQNYSAETAGDFQRQVYDAMIAVKSIYPDGTSWTNENRSYTWQSGNVIYNGAGCAAFAYMLSDAAFGTLPARQTSSFSYEDIRTGDILRINNNTHSVVVLEKKDNNLIIAEGNINRVVMWGRSLPKSTALAGILTTRYPEASAAPATVAGFTDVAASSPFAEAIQWAVDQKITTGKTATTFGPGDPCTISHGVTFLWRAAGRPDPSDTEYAGTADRDKAMSWGLNDAGFVDRLDNADDTCSRLWIVHALWVLAGSPQASKPAAFTDINGLQGYEQDAIAWAVEKGITTGTSAATFAPAAPCTRGQIVTFLYRASK